LRPAPAPALDALGEFQPEIARGDELVVTVIVDAVAGRDEFPAEERPAFDFENLWPELDSPAPAQRELPKRSSFSHRSKAPSSSIARAWIWPFTWGAAVGATVVFLLTAGARQMRPMNDPLSSGRMPFALITPPSAGEDQIVVTTPPVLRPRPEAHRQAPHIRPAPDTGAAPEVRNVQRFTGGLEITSEPEGALVFVNGRLEGVTPLVIDGLPIGTRAVRIETEDYIVWSSSIRVVANERTRVAVTLTRR
jgi:hypothetical protein